MTDCITLSPLADDDLMAALDGEADGQILNHLQACAYCSERLEHMRRFEQGMHTLMYRSDCPSANELADYVLGVSVFGRQQYIDHHLQNCLLCQEEIQDLQTILVADAEATEAEFSLQPIWQQVKGWIQNFENGLITILTPNLLVSPQLRGPDDRERVLNYEHGSISIMLRLEKIVDGLKVNGTILDSENDNRWVGAHAELTTEQQGQQERFLAIIDDDETFTFEQLTSGVFQLSIYAVDDHILRLNDIELIL